MADEHSARGPAGQADESDDDLEEVDARERARIHRREHDAAAAARDLMRPGMGKVFKQILDTQRKAAEEPPKRRGGRRG